MLLTEISIVFSDNSAKHINVLCRQNAKDKMQQQTRLRKTLRSRGSFEATADILKIFKTAKIIMEIPFII
jgi:hypothetical protein